MNNELSVGGRHVIADMSGVAAEALRNPEPLMGRLAAVLRQAGFHVLKAAVHKFPGGGQGFTGVALLSESHAAVHTYPEAGYLALDIFSCGDVDPQQVVRALGEFVEAREVVIRQLARAPAGRPHVVPSV